MGAYAALYGGIEERLTAAEDLRANGAGQHAMWRFIDESSRTMHSSVRRERAFLRLWWAVQGSVSIGSVVSLIAGTLVLGELGISVAPILGAAGVVGLAIGFGLLLGGALLVYLAGDILVERFFGTDRDAVVRTSIWAAHWKAFLAAPIMGYGMGTSESVNLTVMSASTFDYLMNIRGILNVYLQWLEQAGVLGAVPMFLCIAWLIIRTGGGTFGRTRMTLPLMGLLAVDAVFLLHGITDFALEAYSMSAFWAYLLGLQFALAQGTSSR
jgi:O-antigen ligase